MLKWWLRRRIDAFEEDYDYDTSHMLTSWMLAWARH
jgi:hypothetical protein